MPYGLKSKVIDRINSIFTKYPQIEKVILYGSRAKGNYENGSDIDLSMIGIEIDLNVLNKIENELDDLLLPYSIDLSNYSHISNTDLLDHINRVGKGFFIREEVI